MRSTGLCQLASQCRRFGALQADRRRVFARRRFLLLRPLGFENILFDGVLALQEDAVPAGGGTVGEGPGAPGGPLRSHELVIMIGGGVTFVFSFFTWFVDELDGVEQSSASAWGRACSRSPSSSRSSGWRWPSAPP